MSTTTQPPKPKRRWYQFRLKTLLIAVTVAAFGCWVQYRRLRARENRDRVAAEKEWLSDHSYWELRPQTWLEEQFDDPGGADDPVGVYLGLRPRPHQALPQCQIYKN